VDGQDWGKVIMLGAAWLAVAPLLRLVNWRHHVVRGCSRSLSLSLGHVGRWKDWQVLEYQILLALDPLDGNCEDSEMCRCSSTPNFEVSVKDISVLNPS